MGITACHYNVYFTAPGTEDLRTLTVSVASSWPGIAQAAPNACGCDSGLHAMTQLLERTLGIEVASVQRLHDSGIEIGTGKVQQMTAPQPRLGSEEEASNDFTATPSPMPLTGT